MKTLRILSSLLLAVSFVAACSSAQRPVEARSQGVNPPAAGPALLNPEWELGTPLSFRNLTVFPVLASHGRDTSEFITLEEGIRTGGVTISEAGARGRARRLRPGQEPSEAADVNKLLLTNRSGKTLILIAGEIVVGGKQDRIVAHDCLIASGAKPVPLDVFCVEQGRWSENLSFGRSRSVRQNTAAGSGNQALLFAPAAGLIAPPEVREKAQATKDQGEVWANIQKFHSENVTTSRTGRLNAVYENRAVMVKISDYRRALRRLGLDPRVVGAVAAVGAH